MEKPRKLISRKKKILFSIILIVGSLTIILIFPGIWLLGHYAYQKLTLSLNYSGSYGQLDGEIGWVLKKNASATMSLTNVLQGKRYYFSRVFTNEMGFRSSYPPAKMASGATVTVGDSWTFGYCIDYEETYPFFLEKELATQVVNLGVPCHSTAQTLLLLKRHLDFLRPQRIIYLDFGLYERSDGLYHLSQPDQIVSPIMWWNAESGAIEIATPPLGHVFSSANKGVFPSGFFTSGYDGMDYLLIHRPKQILNEAKNHYLAMLPSWGKKKGEIPQTIPPQPNRRPEMFKFILSQFVQMAKEHSSELIFWDPPETYLPYVKEVTEKENYPFTYLGQSDWRDNVEIPAQKFPPEKVRVPGDGHFGEAINKLMAQHLARIIKEKSSAP